MKKLKENGNAIRVILILSATGLMGLSNPYGTGFKYGNGKYTQELGYADSMPSGPMRIATCMSEWDWSGGQFTALRFKVDTLLGHGHVPLVMINSTGDKDSSFIEKFLPETLCDPDHYPGGYNDSLNTLYHEAFRRYFEADAWPWYYDPDTVFSARNELWKLCLHDFCSEFGDDDLHYFEIENEINCCHRSQMLRWLAFGFGCDSIMRANYPAETLNYLIRTVDVWGTKVRVHILPDNMIYNINPFWQGGTTEDMKILSGGRPVSDSLRDTLCVYEIYCLPDTVGNRHDTFYMVIPYNLKLYIVDTLLSARWFVSYVLEPAYDSLHAHFENATVMGPNTGYAPYANQREYDSSGAFGPLYKLLPYSDLHWPDVSDPWEVAMIHDTVRYYGSDHFDAVSIHDYSNKWPWDTLYEDLVYWDTVSTPLSGGHGIFKDKKVWCTEFGPHMRNAKEWGGNDSLAAHAKMHMNYLDIFRAVWDSLGAGIEGLTQYTLSDDVIDSAGQLVIDRWGLLSRADTTSDPDLTPRPAYYAYQNYIQAYALNDTLLASRHSEATFGPGNKIALVPALGTISKCWVAFPYKQYEPAQESLVLKGIRVLKMDTLGSVDTVINLTGTPYNKVNQVAIGVAGGRPCIAFTTSDSGNLFYWHRGMANPERLWSSGTRTGRALFPDIQGLGDTIHIVFYGRYQSSYYVRWLKFRYDNSASNPTNLNVSAEPAWLSFDLNNQRYPWVVWGRENSVYLSQWNGSAWGATKTVVSSYAKWPDIAMSGSDTAWVAWHNPDKDSIFVKGYQPYNPFGTPIFNGSVGPARAEASYPRIDYYPNKAYLLWADSNRVEVDPQTHSVNPYKPWSYDILYAHGRSSFTRASMGDTPLHSLYPSFSVRAADKLLSVWAEGSMTRTGFGMG